MRSRTRSVKLPHDLIDACERRARDLGYPSLNAYVIALMRYDLMVRGPHHVTLPIARMPLAEQDNIDARLLELEKQGKGERGVFFEHLIRRMQGETADPNAAGEAVANIASRPARGSRSTGGAAREK